MGLRETIIWDHEYTGDRWTYALTLRPAGIGTHPEGEIVGTRRAHPDYRHGTLEYARELTAAERYRFDLVLLAEPGGEVGTQCASGHCERILTAEDVAESGAVGVCCACTNYR